MNTYRFIEYSSKKRSQLIQSDKKQLKDVMAEIYKNRMGIYFHENGDSKGFFSIYINSRQVTSINNTSLENMDEILIVASISGG